MRVALLAPANSIHTVQWVNGLASRGLSVHLLSVHPALAGVDPTVTVHALRPQGGLGYVAAVPAMRRVLKRLQPDLVHAHYATGYGAMAAAVRGFPVLLSAWGSDVYDFPDRSWLHRWVLMRHLRKATALASTSHCMAARVRQFAPEREVFVTPFGVDTERFVPEQARNSVSGAAPDERRVLRIGTAKILAPVYGFDILLRAFAQVRAQGVSVELVLAGDGPQRGELQALVQQLGLADAVQFLGALPHSEVPRFLQSLDVFAALSRQESFGVAALEAGACGVPAVLSDAPGFAEVAVAGHTALLVPRDDVAASSQAMLTLLRDEPARRRMGEAARAHVNALYSWPRVIDSMLLVYQTVLARTRRS
ncbi:glycosyltransferase [Roseateles sp.]|uniref:glycosyltransferase n=1 Tax=Roseateles sp. TaxID=1971397 RepID=UPI003D14C8DB